MEMTGNFGFIKTSDAQTADILKEHGLRFLHKEGNRYVFVMQSRDEFATLNIDKTKCEYTQKLCF